MAEGERVNAEGLHQARVLRDIASRIEKGETAPLPPDEFQRLVRVFVDAVNREFARELRDQLAEVRSERHERTPDDDEPKG